MPRKRGKKRKAPTEAKWKIVKKAALEMGFDEFDSYLIEGLNQSPLDVQCKQVARKIPRTYKNEAEIANFGLFLLGWNEEGCDVNCDGMSTKEASRRLKEKDVPEQEEEEVLNDANEEEDDLEDKVPRPRKKRRTPSPDLLLEEPEENEPFPGSSRRKRSLRNKSEPLQELLEEKEEAKASKPSPSSPVLDDDLFSELDDDDEKKDKDKEKAKEKQLEEPLPKPKPKPPSPPPAEDDDGEDFLENLFQGSQSQELLPPASASIPNQSSLQSQSQELLPPPASASIPNQSSLKETQPFEPTQELEPEADDQASVKSEEDHRDWEQTTVLIKFRKIDPDDPSVIKMEEVSVSESSIKSTTTVRRLKRKITKHAGLRIINYAVILMTPEGEHELDADDNSVTELDTVQNIRQLYGIKWIELELRYSVLINFKLFGNSEDIENEEGEPLYKTTLCFKESATVDSIRGIFDDFDNDRMWVNGKETTMEQAQAIRFKKSQRVYHVVFSNGDIEVPDSAIAVPDSIP